jgi:hypothetical protein
MLGSLTTYKKVNPIMITTMLAIPKPITGFMFFVKLKRIANVKRSPIMKPVDKNAVAYPL